jgi:hypothetical protein
VDWAHSYEQTRKRFERDLVAARDRGQTTYRFGRSGRLLDPSRLSLARIQELARREAAATVDRAINKHNEDVDRRERRRRAA